MIDLWSISCFWLLSHLFAWVYLILSFAFGIQEAKDLDEWYSWGAEFKNLSIKRAQVTLFFELRDIWVGIYWKRYPKAVELFITFVPCLPIRIYYQWS